jgi:5-methylcytosine-specific restriction enzyme subunit McrC
MEIAILEPEEKTIHHSKFGIPYQNLWYMLLYAWNEPPKFRGEIAEEIEKAPSLDALLCLVLIKLVQQRFRIGLGRNYIDEQNIIRGIRGKIDFGESLKRNLFNRGRAYCEYQTFSVNVLKNQIIRTTLMRMIRLGQFGSDLSFEKEVKQKLRMLSRVMDGIDFIELSPDLIHRLPLGRNDRDYRIMLAICELLLFRYMPSDTEGEKSLLEIEREKLRMFNVFERFVANFYKFKLQGWEVVSQKVLNWHEMPSNNYMPNMQPDLFLRNKENKRIIIVDTKFTSQTSKSVWKETYHSSHLYQIYAYLKSQEHLSENYVRAEGILLYPASGTTKHSDSMELQNHKIRIEYVDLTMGWEDIENQLKELILCEDHALRINR